MTVTDPDALFTAVRQVVNAQDPEELLALGAPEDEYDPEVEALVGLALAGEDICPDRVMRTFRDFFGEGTSLKAPQAEAIASGIRGLVAA